MGVPVSLILIAAGAVLAFAVNVVEEREGPAPAPPADPYDAPPPP